MLHKLTPKLLSVLFFNCLMSVVASQAGASPDHGAAATKADKPMHRFDRARIIESSLSGHPALDYLIYVPESAPERPDVLISVHGISRNAREQIEHFQPLSERYGIVLVAPEFTDKAYPDYQRLGRRGKGLRADSAMDSLIETLKQAGASKQFYLFGYSGGGQFAHRYVMAHPEKVRAVVAAAAGWYTFPDQRRDYPYGLRVNGDLSGVRFLREEFLRVPALAVVGSKDTTRDENLRRSRRLDAQQGRTRVERGRNWVAAMCEASIQQSVCPTHRFEVLRGVGHSFEESMSAGLGQLVLEFFDSVDANLSQPMDGAP